MTNVSPLADPNLQVPPTTWSQAWSAGIEYMSVQENFLTAAAVATTNVATLSGLPTIDGVQVAARSYVLLTAQSSPNQNGLWSVSFGPWVQSNVSGVVFVQNGAAYGGTMWTFNAAGQWLQIPSSTPAGVPITHKLGPFAYNNPTILTGIPLYTPTIGDILWESWFEIDTPWNGTSPRGDLGQFDLGTIDGLWYATRQAGWDMTAGDTQFPGSYLTNTSSNDGSLLSTQSPNFSRIVPGKFVSAAPINMIVTQTGRLGGASPGATQGSAYLYIVTMTPKTS